MATRAEMEHLVSKLRTNGSLKWVVTGQPVVALFDQGKAQPFNQLGQPLKRNGVGDLLLWIAVDNQVQEFLIALTIRIKVSPVRKRGQRQGRLMYLVVPAESLVLKGTRVGYHSLGEVLQDIGDVPDDAESAKSKLLHIAIDIGPATTKVIMPEYECKTEVSPQPMTLLCKLKGLSEASRFDLYMNDDAKTYDAVEEVRDMLLNANTNATTPSIDLKGLYPGGRPAGFNIWAKQGWRDKELIPDRPSFKGDGVHVLQANKEPSSSGEHPPPQYEPLQLESSKHLPSTAAQASPSHGSTCLPSIAASQTPQKSPSLLSTVGSPSAHPSNDSFSRPCQSRPAHMCATVLASVESASSDHVSLTPERNRWLLPSPLQPSSSSSPSLSSRYTATFLSDFSDQLPQHIVLAKAPQTVSEHSVHPPSDRYQWSCLATNGSSGHAVEVAASTMNSSNVSVVNDHRSADVTDRVTDSIARKRAFSLSPEDAISIPKRVSHQPPAHAHHSNLDLNRLPKGDDSGPSMSPTVADDLSYHVEHTTTPEVTKDTCMSTFVQETSHISQWLAKAWVFCPRAHYVFIAELLRLGVAAEKGNDDANVIIDRRIECTIALLEHCTSGELSRGSDTGHIVAHISDDLSALISWLYRLQPGADMDFFPILLKLSLLERQSLQLPTGEGDHNDLTAKYVFQKADLVSQACMRYGEKVLERDEGGVIARMMQKN